MAAALAPVLPGWDSLGHLEGLPLMRPGETARLSSSFDRRGGNDDGASGRFSCLRRLGTRCVLAEHSGPGELDSVWLTRVRAGDVRRTGTLRVELDGRRVLDDRLTRIVAGGVGGPFTFPLVASARQASGAVWIKAPMPFASHMRVTTESNPRYFHVNYRTFDPGTAVTPFDPAGRPASVLEILRRAGTRDPKPVVQPLRRAQGASVRLTGPGTITQIRVGLTRRPSLAALRDARLSIRFDGRLTVNAPLGEFFASGIPARVRSLLVAQDAAGRFTSWWPMPFRSSAEVRLAGPVAGRLAVTSSNDPRVPDALARGEAGYFRATSRRGATRRGRPWRLLEARGPGLLTGVSATLAGPTSQRHLEGDERIVADGVALPGTGPEDFFEGGFYWHFGTRTLPLVGSPAHRVRGGGCAADCRSMYRLLLADAVPFRSSLRFTLEHGHANSLPGVYSTTAFWYGP